MICRSCTLAGQQDQPPGRHLGAQQRELVPFLVRGVHQQRVVQLREPAVEDRVADPEPGQVGQGPFDAGLLGRAGPADQLADRSTVAGGRVDDRPVAQLVQGDQPFERGERAPLGGAVGPVDVGAQPAHPGVLVQQHVDHVRIGHPGRPARCRWPSACRYESTSDVWA